jgi:hypothetical protein
MVLSRLAIGFLLPDRGETLFIKELSLRLILPMPHGAAQPRAPTWGCPYRIGHAVRLEISQSWCDLHIEARHAAAYRELRRRLLDWQRTKAA